MAKGLSSGSWIVRPSSDDENVEDDARRGHARDNGCDSDVDLPKVAREGTARSINGNKSITQSK